jgi:hypothetical protein
LQVRSPPRVVGHLQAVVVRSPDVPPRKQRTELVVVEGVRPELAVGQRGTELVDAVRQIQIFQS